ncbi:33584_t:CDS:2, partial [Gigaspora margarita]
ILLQNLELLDYVYNSVEYRFFDACRHKKVVKIAIASVFCNETKDHSNRYYCLASIKGARQFVCTFPNVSVIISQDNKAKIDLEILAVGRIFYTLQSASEPVQLPDHDFVCENSQKLILLVYLIIKPNKENDDLQTEQYSEALKINNEIKPILVLLVNGGPNESSRHFKNIESYFMAILLGKLAGIILLIDYFEKHLDSQNNINDTNLVAQNFNYTRMMLYDI